VIEPETVPGNYVFLLGSVAVVAETAVVAESETADPTVPSASVAVVAPVALVTASGSDTVRHQVPWD
jgi:hypothetical protein